MADPFQLNTVQFSTLKASQSQAQTGTDDTTYMTPLKVKNAIDFNGASNTVTLPTSDDSVSGLRMSSITAAETLAFGQVCYVNSGGQLALADADSSTTAPAVAMSTGAVTSGSSATPLTYGYAYDTAWSWTPGAVLYLSTTAGSMTETAPSGTGDQVQVLGVALSANLVHFNPSLVLVKVA